jgi:GT2 family glycosyltransferase
MNNKESIGVGVITCNRPKYVKRLLRDLFACNDIDELVVVNDGAPIADIDQLSGNWIDNKENLGVAKTKNKALQFLLSKSCKYIFLIEDDVIIKNPNVFSAYINASKETNIKHFNYGPGTPFNRKQDGSFDIHNRHELSTVSDANPKLIVDYKTTKIALYEHIAGMFSFFDSDVLKTVGLFDERFFNAWEHVDHTYRIIKAGFHPPFWWFADIATSEEYIGEYTDAIANSAISKNNSQWLENVKRGQELYKQIHGHFPNQPPYVTKDFVIQTLKYIKNG